jgi:hypothetical protein
VINILSHFQVQHLRKHVTPCANQFFHSIHHRSLCHVHVLKLGFLSVVSMELPVRFFKLFCFLWIVDAQLSEGILEWCEALWTHFDSYGAYCELKV